MLLLLAAGVATAVWLYLRPQPAIPVYSVAAVDFGPQRVGRAGEAIAVAIANGGERPMRLDRFELTGPDAGDYGLGRDTCSGEIRLPQESCELEIVFEPRGVGIRRAALEPTGNLAWSTPELPLLGLGIAPRAVAEPAAVDFGQLRATETSESSLVRISNAGSDALAIEAIVLEGDDPRDFVLEERCAQRTFGLEERCAFRVSFSPRAAGPRTAFARLDSDSPGEPVRVRLSGTGLWSGPAFTVQPERLDFGSQRTGRTGENRDVVLVNRTGESRAAPAVIAPRRDSGFAVARDGCDGATLAPGEGCTLALTFTPPAEGRLEGALTLREPDGGTVNVTLTGAGVAPRLAIDRRTLDFGDMRVGFRSAGLRVTLHNTGTDSLAIRSLAVTGSAAAAFTVLKDRCSGGRLSPDRRCSLEVVFAPSAEGEHSARLELGSDASPEPEKILLAGRGTMSGFAVRPGRLEFGTVIRGERAVRELQITNSGSAKLEIRGLRTDGPDDDDFQVSRIGCRLDQGLAPQEACALELTFAPARDGARTARLLVLHDGPDSPREIPLTGSGTPPLPDFDVTPARLDFGTRRVGSRSGIQTVTVSNPGKGRLVIRDFLVAGSHAEDFQVVPGSCAGAPAVVPGSECTTGVRFHPQSAGRREAELVVRHNAARGRSTVRLIGEATE